MKIFFTLYSFIIYLLTPLFILRLKWKSRTNKAYKQRISERFGYYGQKVSYQPHDVWIHAVSFGEVEVAQLLIRHWCQQGRRVLVTTTTPTGSKRVQDLFANKVTHVYLPFEWPGAIKRFLTFFRPKQLVIVETELWPNLLKVCSRSKVPITIINARLSEKSMRGYAYISFLIKHILSKAQLVIAQSAKDGERFVRLGLEPASLLVAGNLKFDTPYPTFDANEIKELRCNLFGFKSVFIAASTHPGEEVLILKAFIEACKVRDNLVLVLAPRHPERSGEILSVIKAAGLSCVQRTQNRKLSKNESVFMLDTLGELQLFYQLSDLAFVGGSLVPHGGHNVLEPIRAHIPVLVGLHMHNFSFIADELLKARGIIQVEDEDMLGQEVIRLLDSPQSTDRLVSAANAFLTQHQGALAKSIKAIDSVL